MATRKIHGGMMFSGPGGGANKNPFKLGNFKPGPQNAMNNNSPNTRRRKKKTSGASEKKRRSAKNYKDKFKGKNGVVVKLTNFRNKTLAKREKTSAANAALQWSMSQVGLSNYKSKKSAKSTRFANEKNE